jgi:hypothetical protein
VVERIYLQPERPRVSDLLRAVEAECQQRGLKAPSLTRTRASGTVAITPEGKPANVDGGNYYIRDGVVVVPKGAVISDGTRI